MKTVKVTFEDGNTLVTRINATFQEAETYYLGRMFNLGQGENDYCVKAVKVEDKNEN